MWICKCRWLVASTVKEPAWHKHDWPLKNRLQHDWFTVLRLQTIRCSIRSIAVAHVKSSFRSLFNFIYVLWIFGSVWHFFRVYLTALHYSPEHTGTTFRVTKGGYGYNAIFLSRMVTWGVLRFWVKTLPFAKQSDILRTFWVEALLSNIILNNEKIYTIYDYNIHSYTFFLFFPASGQTYNRDTRHHATHSKQGHGLCWLGSQSLCKLQFHQWTNAGYLLLRKRII